MKELKINKMAFATIVEKQVILQEIVGKEIIMIKQQIFQHQIQLNKLHLFFINQNRIVIFIMLIQHRQHPQLEWGIIIIKIYYYKLNIVFHLNLFIHLYQVQYQMKLEIHNFILMQIVS